MAVSKLSRRIGGLTAAIVLGIGGMGAVAAPALADDATASVVMQIDNVAYKDGVVAQVGQTIYASLDSDADSDAVVSWAWYCGETKLDQWGGAGDSSTFTVSPDNLKCTPAEIHAEATVSKKTVASDAVPLTTVSLDSGYQYTDFQDTPSWQVLQGYDPSTLPVGTVVVTNWGTTAVTGLSCSMKPQPGDDDVPSRFTIVTKPASSLKPGTATIVQILPKAGIKGTDDGTRIAETVACTAKNTKWATAPQDANVSLTVYSKPTIDVYAYKSQVGDVLSEDLIQVFPTPDSVSYEWYSLAADGTTQTSLAKDAPYTIKPADVGKSIGVSVTATIPGHGSVSADKDLGTVPSVAVTQGEYWYLPYGYTAKDFTTDHTADKSSVTFTNYGKTAIEGTITCDSDSSALVCGTVPGAIELAPGKSTSTFVITPKVGQKIGSYSAWILLSNDDYSVYSYSYTDLTVVPAPFDWIQPLESTPASSGTSTAPANGSGTGTGTSSTSENHSVDTGGTVSHGSTGIALLGLGFITLGAVILKRRTA